MYSEKMYLAGGMGTKKEKEKLNIDSLKSPKYSTTDIKKIKEIINEINYSNKPGPGKAAKWGQNTYCKT